jgi:guanine deaminase
LFKEGYQFDAILIDADSPGSNLRLDAANTPEQILQRIVYGATRANIRDVWVAGRRVHTQGDA